MSDKFIEGTIENTIDLFFEINQAISNVSQQAKDSEGQTLLILNSHLIRLCEMQESILKEDVMLMGQCDAPQYEELK